MIQLSVLKGVPVGIIDFKDIFLKKKKTLMMYCNTCSNRQCFIFFTFSMSITASHKITAWYWSLSS